MPKQPPIENSEIPKDSTKTSRQNIETLLTYMKDPQRIREREQEQAREQIEANKQPGGPTLMYSNE